MRSYLEHLQTRENPNEEVNFCITGRVCCFVGSSLCRCSRCVRRRRNLRRGAQRIGDFGCYRSRPEPRRPCAWADARRHDRFCRSRQRSLKVERPVAEPFGLAAGSYMTSEASIRRIVYATKPKSGCSRACNKPSDRNFGGIIVPYFSCIFVLSGDS